MAGRVGAVARLAGRGTTGRGVVPRDGVTGAPAVAHIREQHPGQPVVVVSHVSPIKLMLRDALGAGDVFLQRLHLDPAGLSIVDSWPDGGVPSVP